MRQVIVTSIVTMLMLIGLFVVSVPILDHHKEFTETFHKTIYLDRFMAEDEVEKVIQAALEWHEATGGRVTFDVERLPNQDINPDDALLMVEVTPDYPEIIMIDRINMNNTLGYYTSKDGLPYIALVSFRIDQNDFKEVVLHELGHAVGLGHNYGPEGIGTLMHPIIGKGANYITDTDIDNFCLLYKCDPKPLHHK